MNARGLLPVVGNSVAADYTQLSPAPSRWSRVVTSVESFFEIQERGSTIKTECRAGLILYATMCYIIVVNPEIMSAAGIDRGATASATAACGMICTLLFGLVANLPFGSAPGMGLNTLFAYELVRQNHLTKEQALAACFIAGCIFLLLGMTGLCTTIISQVPLSLKKAVVVGIGLLQTIIGLSAMGFIQHGEYTILEAVPTPHASQYMALFTILLIATLILLEIPGSILIGIAVSMIISLLSKMQPLPDSIFCLPYLEIGTFDFSVLQSWKGLSLTFLMFFVLFVDTGGVVVGVAAQGETLLDSKGDCVNSTRAYAVLGVGIICSAFFGTSPMVIFLESAAAVNQGGRTGLTAVVAAILIGLSAFFVPLVRAVPNSATCPVMILVGSFMMGAVLAIPWDKINHSLPAFITISLTAFTCSISHGLLGGVLFYVVLNTPFLVAQLTGWSWLTERLVLDETIPTGLEKRTLFEREVDRRTNSFLSLKAADERVQSAVSTPEAHPRHRRLPAGNIGWL